MVPKPFPVNKFGLAHSFFLSFSLSLSLKTLKMSTTAAMSTSARRVSWKCEHIYFVPMTPVVVVALVRVVLAVVLAVVAGWMRQTDRQTDRHTHRERERERERKRKKERTSGLNRTYWRERVWEPHFIKQIIFNSTHIQERENSPSPPLIFSAVTAAVCIRVRVCVCVCVCVHDRSFWSCVEKTIYQTTDRHIPMALVIINNIRSILRMFCVDVLPYSVFQGVCHLLFFLCFCVWVFFFIIFLKQKKTTKKPSGCVLKSRTNHETPRIGVTYKKQQTETVQKNNALKRFATQQKSVT